MEHMIIIVIKDILKQRKVGSLKKRIKQCDTCRYYKNNVCSRQYLKLEVLGEAPCPLHRDKVETKTVKASKQITFFQEE